MTVKTRTVIRQDTLRAIHAGLASTIARVGERTIELARPPDEPPIGQGLVQTAAWVVTDAGERVAGEADVPPGVDSAAGLTLVVGYGFPARFQERGTVHQPARPFLDPAMVAAIEEVPATAREEVGRHIAGLD